MLKRSFVTFLALAMALSMLPSAFIFAESETDALRAQLDAVIENTLPLVYRDNSEQTGKYLFDRLQRAQAAAADSFADVSALSSALSELSRAEELLAPMKGSERVQLMSFDYLSESDLALMTASAGRLSVDAETKPEAARQSVLVVSDGEAVYDNSAEAGVAGASPFGMDMTDTDGLRLWVSVDAPSVLSLTVGKRSSGGSFSLTARGIRAEGEGYITVPYYALIPDSDGAQIETDGLMNYVRVECSGARELRLADLHAYRELADKSNRAVYSEERVMTRGAIEDNAYYKLYSVDSYGTESPKAVTLGPLPNEKNTSDWAYGLKATLEEAVEGDLTQLWQLTPDPSGNSTFRLINKGSGCALKIDGINLVCDALDYNDTAQEFAVSLTKGEATIQVRGLGKLTYAGNTVKSTATSAYKKFIIAKVNDGEYIQTWSDEFDGEDLNTDIWRADSGFFFGGKNAALYIDSEENTFVEDGNLVLRTFSKDHNGYQATAPHILSSGKYAISHGRIEIRAKMPQGFGMWPALWLMPVDSMNMSRSEIDLMEMPVQDGDYNALGDKAYARQIGTLHWANVAGTDYLGKRVDIFSENFEPLSNDYHTYAIELDTQQARMYFDGALCLTLNLADDGIKFAYGDVPRYIILSSGGIEGMSYAVLDPELEYGDPEMLVDYVRAYIRQEQATDDTPDFTSDASVTEASSVDYLCREFNHFMSSFPMDISPDGTQAVMADQAGLLCVYDPRTTEVLEIVPTGDYTAFLTAAYSRDGKRFAAATMNGCILIYDTSDFTKAPVKIHNGATMNYCLTFTDDGNHLIAGGFNGCAQAQSNPINGSVSTAHYLRVFNAGTGATEQELFVESDPLSVDLSPDGSKLAVTTTSAGVFIFNTSDWSEYAHFTTEHVNTINYCRFSPDGSVLASSDEAGEIVIWDVAEKTAIRRLDTVNESSVSKFAFSPDGKNIVTTSTDHAARVYNVESGRCVSMLGGFAGQIREVAYSPDGRYIAVGSFDQTIKLYYADGTYVSTLKHNSKTVYPGHIASKLCFTPDSKYVLASSYTMPSGIERWELPALTDKTELKAAVEAYDGQDEKLEYAEKVLSLKYASGRLVQDALSALTGSAAPASFGQIAVSADGDSFAPAAQINRNGWVYIKADVSRFAGECSLTVESVSGGAAQTVSAAKLKLCADAADGAYDQALFRTHIDEAGEYRVYLTSEDGSESERVSVTVSDVETTRDFIYTVSDGKVTITGAKTGDEYVYIPDHIDGYPVTNIGSYAFRNYGHTVRHMKLRLPETLKTIGAYAFYECSSLEDAALPEGLETIGTYAFGRCTSMAHIDIPSSVKTLGYNAFYYNRGPSYIRIGGGLTTVPSNSFYMTISNRCFIFDEGVKTINSSVSSIAKLLKRVYIPRSVTSINSYFVSGMMDVVKLYGYPGTYAETFAAQNTRFEFVPLAAPVITGVEEGKTYDLYDGQVSATWDDGHIAYLNGKTYYAGDPITEPGEYTLKVVNGYEEFTTEVSFTVVDTTPVRGDADGDGTVTVSDALLTLRAAAKLYAPTEKVVAAIDLDGDGELTVADALAVLRIAVGL